MKPFSLISAILFLCCFSINAQERLPSVVTTVKYAPSSDDRLTGRLKIYIPPTDLDGNRIWDAWVIVHEDDEVLVSSSATPGTLFVSQNIYFTPGFHDIKVTLRDGQGLGEPAYFRIYAGYDIPTECPDITLATEDPEIPTQVTLRWGKPQTGVNGYDVNPSDMYYTVIRHPGDVMVTQLQRQRSFREVLPDEYDTYTYTVIPTDQYGRQGSPALSNSLIVGKPYFTPYQPNFLNSEKAFNEFTVLDFNEDDCSWTFDYVTRCAKYRCDYVADDYYYADDWLFSPPVKLLGEAAYTLSFDARASLGGYTEALEVRFGDGRHPYLQYDLMLDLPQMDASNREMTSYQGVFTPEFDGLYYFSFHALSSDPGQALYINNIRLEGPSAGIDGVEFNPVHDSSVRWFNLQGQPISGPQRGMPAIRIQNGTAKKVMN